MSNPLKDSFLDLEKHRQLLEDNIEKLQKSLRHWQTWEAEYEGLKEEILSNSPTPSREELAALARDYEGELVTKKEIEDILGATNPRTAVQVVNILDRRIDYVEQNVKTVQKQVEMAENKLLAATVISTPDVRNEEGLPMTEIVEELDDDGNVISGHTSTPGSAAPQLLEVLKKAGVKDLPAEPQPKQDAKATPAAAPETVATSLQGSQSVQSSQKEEIAAQLNETAEAPPKASQPVKSVKFAEDTKSGQEIEMSKTAKRVQEIMDIAKKSEAKPSQPPIIPADESPEDAALRRQMLQYSMSEVGAVVAELELEDGSDWSNEEYNEDSTSSTDDEDEHGRSKGRVVDDEVRQRMIELEERLGVRMMENIGKRGSDYDVVEEGIGRITIKDQEEDIPNNESQRRPAQEDADNKSPLIPTDGPPAKKSVRFSSELDVAPATKTPVAELQSAKEQKIVAAPVSDIVERAPTPKAVITSTASRKPSRFKSGRGVATNENSEAASPPSSTDQPGQVPQLPKPHHPTSLPIRFSPTTDLSRTVPTGPEGKTLAPDVIERDVPLDLSATEPDELDPQLLHQEVAIEYHKMRNRMIQRQGGFLKEEESEIVPFTEEEGGPKKMSRFKAARLARA